MSTAAAFTTTVIGSACRACGAVRKSNKLSCCARGGSWFGNCGGAGNVHLGHTWYEGIQACKGRQFHGVVDQQLHASQSNSNTSNYVNISADSKAVIMVTHMLTSSPANTSTPVAVAASSRVSADMSSRSSAPHESGTTPSKAFPSTVDAMRQASVNMLTPKSLLDNPIIAPKANATILKSVSSPSADTAMAIKSQTPVSAAINTREYRKSLCVLSSIGIILIGVCWY